LSSPNIEEPHYKRIRRQIEMQIRRGELTPGHRLPGERDLASQFGVSQMTANRALHELVHAGWLERRIGSGTYVSAPDKLPTGGQERSLVVVTSIAAPPEEDVYLQAPFSAITAQTTQADCSLLVTQSPEARYGQVVDRYPHAGFIFVAPHEESYDTLCGLHAQRVPFVVLGASWPEAAFACVDSDNLSGACTAVEYLLRLGHERIGFIDGMPNATNCRDRLAGYRQGLAGHGREIAPDWMVGSGSNWELGDQSRRQITELLIRREPVTAILSAGFYLTMSLLELLRGLQLRVPQDVSVISFDDPPGAAYLSPPLSTLKQPLYALGKRAAERALSLLAEAGGQAEEVEYLPVNLIVRGSCARLK
jgi:DNA-binding LacI/PurR family transcriptional regulator